jgi:hypothetical protein
MHVRTFRKTTLAVALVAATATLSSCASVTKDPVNCAVIGSVVGGLAGGALGTVFGKDGNVTGGAILGTALGAGIGAIGGWQICKHPTFESAEEAQRQRRIETSPEPSAEEESAPAEEATE